MFRLLFVIIFLSLVILPLKSHSQETWSDHTRVLPDLLREVPEAIYIIHTPNPNYPELTLPDDDSEYKYVWKHSTSVFSPDMNLTVVKAGSFIWFSEAGWQENVELDRREFAKRFNCPKGRLEQGERYTFEKNYRWGDQLYGGDALWYIIAKDEHGNLYKGMSILETESVIK